LRIAVGQEAVKPVARLYGALLRVRDDHAFHRCRSLLLLERPTCPAIMLAGATTYRIVIG